VSKGQKKSGLVLISRLHGLQHYKRRFLAERTQPAKEGSLAERSQRRFPTVHHEWNGPKAVSAERTQFVSRDFCLIPGMTTTAEIVIGKRTIISYLLDSIVRLFNESLREP
jgi:hypothetical protein